MEDTLEAAMERLNRSVERMIQLRAEHITLKTVEDAIDAAFDNFDVRSELEGIHSMTESSSSLSCDDNNSVNFVDKQEVNIGKEISAYKVFDEMSDRILIGIETQFSDISLCRTILNNNSVGFVEKNEVSSEIEISVHKVFDEIPERIRDEIATEIIVSISDKTVVNDEDDDRELKKITNVNVDSVSSKLDFWQWHCKNKMEDFNQDDCVNVSSHEMLNLRVFNENVCYFWGQKSHKEEVLGTQLAIGSFGWKPGWIVVNRTKDKELDVSSTRGSGLLSCVSMFDGSFEWKPSWISLVRNDNELHTSFMSICAIMICINGADCLSMCLGSKDTMEMAVSEKCCWHMLSHLSIVIGLFEWKLELQYGLVEKFKKIQHECSSKDWGYIVIGIETFGWKPGWLHYLVEKRNKAQHFMEGVFVECPDGELQNRKEVMHWITYFVSSFVMILLKRLLMGESVEKELLADYRLMILIRLQPRNPHVTVLTISGYTNLCKSITWNMVMADYVQLAKFNEILGLFVDIKDKKLGSSSLSFYVSMLDVPLSSTTTTWAHEGKQPTVVVLLTVLGVQSTDIVVAVVLVTCCKYSSLERGRVPYLLIMCAKATLNPVAKPSAQFAQGNVIPTTSEIDESKEMIHIIRWWEKRRDQWVYTSAIIYWWGKRCDQWVFRSTSYISASEFLQFQQVSNIAFIDKLNNRFTKEECWYSLARTSIIVHSPVIKFTNLLSATRYIRPLKNQSTSEDNHRIVSVNDLSELLQSLCFRLDVPVGNWTASVTNFSELLQLICFRLNALYLMGSRSKERIRLQSRYWTIGRGCLWLKHHESMWEFPD